MDFLRNEPRDVRGMSVGSQLNVNSFLDLWFEKRASGCLEETKLSQGFDCDADMIQVAEIMWVQYTILQRVKFVRVVCCDNFTASSVIL